MGSVIEVIEVAGRWRRKAAEAAREGDLERYRECIKHARFALCHVHFTPGAYLP